LQDKIAWHGHDGKTCRTSTCHPVIYQLKVVLQGISPMIWRRLLVCGDSTIADLHYIVQIAMGWSDDHLHQFRIHGKRYGIYRIGGIWFSDDPDSVRLKDLGLRINERFFYEYDFTDDWQHLIRVEAILAPEPHRHYPVCIDGRRACPPEDCGGSLRAQWKQISMSFAPIGKCNFRRFW
jgi:hypothetical protein